MSLPYTIYNKISRSKALITGMLLIFSLSNCSKLVEVNGPDTSVNGENVYKSDATAIAVVTSLYYHMSSSSTTQLAFASGLNGISYQVGLSSDEDRIFSGLLSTQTLATYKNALSTSLAPVFWNTMHSFLYRVNNAMEGISQSATLTPAVKNQLLGETRFLRAFVFFYLTNLYGEIPLAVSSDYSVNAALPRSPKAEVWKQIITDLKEAEVLLTDGYVDGTLLNMTSERIRPSRPAATAMLARAYLYVGDFGNAEISASNLISRSSVYDTVALANVFLKNNKEAIWQLQPVLTGWNTEDGKVFSLASAPVGLSAGKPVFASTFLMNAFEIGDQRKTEWIGNYTDASGSYPFFNKYKVGSAGSPVSEYATVLRLAEVYLIRAEARAQLGKFAEAQADLNVIRKRARLASTTATDKTSLLTAILHERQVELFSEWGHRWFDLKRTGNIDAIMSAVTPQKGGSWNSNWQFYPIPLYDIQKGTALVQNAGY